MPTAWFFKGIAVLAHGAFGRFVCWSVDRKERNVGKAGRVNGFFGVPVDYGSGSNNHTALRGCQFNSFPYGAACCYHILDGEDPFPLPYCKPPAKLHPAVYTFAE